MKKWLFGKSAILLQNVKVLVEDEQGADGGSQGVSFLGGMFIGIVVIGIIIIAVRLFLPDLFNDIFDQLRTTLEL